MTYEVGILCHLHMSFYYRGHLLNIVKNESQEEELRIAAAETLGWYNL